MIQILPCPACQRSTVLMEGVSLEANIQCPHCEEQFVVGELLTSNFGTWKVLDDPALPHGTPETVAAGGSAEDDGEELRMAPLEKPRWTGTGPNRRLTRRARGKANPNTDWSKFEPITYEQFEELRRQAGGGSPVRTIIQIALGGLAAIPISLLLIWHVLGTDVMGAGPVVARYAPWIVPARFRPAAEEDGQAIAGEPVPPEAGTSGFRNLEEELGISWSTESEEMGARMPTSPGPSGLSDEMSAAGMPTSPGPAESGAGRPTVLGLDDTSESSSITPSSSDQPTKPETKATPPGGKSLPSDNAQTRPQALSVASDAPAAPPSVPGREGNAFDLIRQSIAKLNAWRENETAEDQTQSKAIFQDLTKLAFTLHNVPKQNPVLRTMREEMQPIGRNIQQHAELQRAITSSAQSWLNEQKEKDMVPLAWVMVVESAVEKEGTWVVTPTADSHLKLGDQLLTVRIPRALSPSLTPGQSLLMLGTVSRSPLGPSQPTPPLDDAIEPITSQPSEGQATEKPTEPAPSPASFSADYLYSL